MTSGDHKSDETVASEEAIHYSHLQRNALNFFERYDWYDCRELLAYQSTHWMLSTDDYRIPTDQPLGLITNINPQNSNKFVLLMPVDEDVAPLDYREIHQIIRELTTGLYVLHQTPHILLEANYDQSTSCQLPPAYINTRVGQVLINVDYMMKALWHGSYFPKDKRTKFSERWKSNLDVNQNGKPETKKSIFNEFTSAGMLDLTKDPDYVGVYDDLPMDHSVDAELAEELRFFMSHVDDLSMQITYFQKKVQHHKDLFLIDSDWTVSSVVKALSDRLDHSSYERINTRLQMQEQLIKGSLGRKADVRRHLYLLKLISYLTPFLIGMRKRMKIPDIDRLLPNLTESRQPSDECRTEKELPPLLLGSDFRCKNFNFGNRYFHLHGGILVDLETDSLEEAPECFSNVYDEVIFEATTYINHILDMETTMKDQYQVPIKTIDGKKYYMILMEFETFYPQTPQKPLWVRAFHEEMTKLKLSKLTFNDTQMYEHFKRFFGYKRAINYKTPLNGLKASAHRGLVAMFQTSCRKMQPARLSKQDEHGLSFLHHAAMNNHPNVIALLLLQSMDVNVRKNNLSCPGPTALHLAARSGALDSVACLLANFANILATDQEGWAPLHHASFADHDPVIKLMVRKNRGLLELTTKNELRSTSLLLAASYGALAAIKCLIELGADIKKTDTEGNGLVMLAALRFHTNILEFLIEWDNPNAPVWEVLVDMLQSDDMKKKDSGVKCLEVLSTSRPQHWACILNAGAIPALVEVLKIDSDDLQAVTSAVLCNISEHEPVRKALSNTEAGSVITHLLSSAVDEIQSRAAIILSDLACVEGYQDSLAEYGSIPSLVNLLDSELVVVLVNAVNAIRVMCMNNSNNQKAVAECNGLEPLVEFLSLKSDDLHAATSAAIAAVCRSNTENQDAVIMDGAARALVDLLRGRKVHVQVKVANAIEALAKNNSISQITFMNLDTPKALISLLKDINVEVREQAACALWSLAGHTKTQQKTIAEITGIPYIKQMLLEKTEKLLHVGSVMAIALGREDMEFQNKLAEAETFQQLTRLLRSDKTSNKVLLMVIKLLGILCVGVAYRNNKLTQGKITEEGAIPLLVQLLNFPPSEEIQVEVAMSLACIVLGNHENQEKLQEENTFKFDLLLDLLKSRQQQPCMFPSEISHKAIRLRAGMALTIFAFNNTPQQFAIREAGGINYSVFQPFIDSEDEYFNCYAAFQTIVLARVIIDEDQVCLTARGVTLLVDKLVSEDDNAVVLAASLLSSLAHTRAGITDAMVTTGALELLIDRLNSDNDQVRNSSAVALGYLTFNRTAARYLFGACRNTPGLYKQMMDNIGKNPKINSEFVEDFRMAKHVGLPSQCLEINGGHRIGPPSSKAKGHRPFSSKSVLYSRPFSQRTVSSAKSTPSIMVSKFASSRPSTCRTRSSILRTPTDQTRPLSAMSSVSKTMPRSDTGFKSHLASWKEH